MVNVTNFSGFACGNPGSKAINFGSINLASFQNINLYDFLKREKNWTGSTPCRVTFVIPKNVVIGSASNLLPSMRTGVFPRGSEVSLVIESGGLLVGAGGDGGVPSMPSKLDYGIGGDGQQGGPALLVEFPIVVLNLGSIGAGGGGGGASGGGYFYNGTFLAGDFGGNGAGSKAGTGATTTTGQTKTVGADLNASYLVKVGAKGGDIGRSGQRAMCGQRGSVFLTERDKWFRGGEPGATNYAIIDPDGLLTIDPKSTGRIFGWKTGLVNQTFEITLSDPVYYDLNLYDILRDGQTGWDGVEPCNFVIALTSKIGSSTAERAALVVDRRFPVGTKLRLELKANSKIQGMGGSGGCYPLAVPLNMFPLSIDGKPGGSAISVDFPIEINNLGAIWAGGGGGSRNNASNTDSGGSGGAGLLGGLGGYGTSTTWAYSGTTGTETTSPKPGWGPGSAGGLPGKPGEKVGDGSSAGNTNFAVADPKGLVTWINRGNLLGLETLSG